MVELIPWLIRSGRKRKPTRRLMGFKRRLHGLRKVPGAISAESAERYRRFTCQRSTRGVATRATGTSEGVIGEDLHRYVQT